jgi:hypothetical protein
VAGAAALALNAAPDRLVERLYATGAYPVIQSVLTGLSNLLPWAAFDLVLTAGACALAAVWLLALFRARRERRWGPLVLASWRTMGIAVVAYVWFLGAWGLNYGRPALDERLGLPPWRADPDAVAALLARAVAGANADFARAHAEGFPGPHDVPAPIAAALHAVERTHGRPRPTTPGRPKPTILGAYFRVAGVDGLTAPAALETLLNPDLTGPERPFTLAHEWAHLAGYAPEADANFVAWLTTQHAGAPARYSSWLFLLSEASRQVPGAARRAALEQLGGGPRRDLADIARRAESRVDVVERLGWRVYDGYLKSQGVREGIVSYSRVVELIIRTEQAAVPPAP